MRNENERLVDDWFFRFIIITSKLSFSFGCDNYDGLTYDAGIKNEINLVYGLLVFFQCLK